MGAATLRIAALAVAALAVAGLPGGVRAVEVPESGLAAASAHQEEAVVADRPAEVAQEEAAEIAEASRTAEPATAQEAEVTVVVDAHAAQTAEVTNATVVAQAAEATEDADVGRGAAVSVRADEVAPTTEASTTRAAEVTRTTTEAVYTGRTYSELEYIDVIDRRRERIQKAENKASEPSERAARAQYDADRIRCSDKAKMRRRALAGTRYPSLRFRALQLEYSNCTYPELAAVDLRDGEPKELEADAGFVFRPRPWEARVEGEPERVPLSGDVAVRPRRAPGCVALLYVAVSPLLVAGKSRRLAELFWDYEHCPDQPAAAAIYLGEERAFQNVDELNPAPVWRADITGASGRVLTDFAVPRELPAGWAQGDPGPRPAGEFCRPFRAVLVDAAGTHLQTACLLLRPSWMEQLVAHGLGVITPHALLLPGTHNAGSYARPGEAAGSHVTRFLHAQEYSVWEQLVSGVRYLDLRVGYYPDNMGDQRDPAHPDHNQKFWINHDMARVQPLRPVLAAVRAFVEGRGELVLLHFHRFPVGFSSAGVVAGGGEEELRRHAELLALLREELDGLLVRHDHAFRSRTLDDVLTSGGRVLVSYAHTAFQRQESGLLHPAIPQYWGDKQTLPELLDFIELKLNDKMTFGQPLFATMAHLTPTPLGVLLNLQRYGLRNLANLVNENITAMCRRPSWYTRANIVAVDFVESTDLVSVAVAANWRMASRRKEERRIRALERQLREREKRERGYRDRQQKELDELSARLRENYWSRRPGPLDGPLD